MDQDRKKQIALLGSMALNAFLVAFVIGQMPIFGPRDGGGPPPMGMEMRNDQGPGGGPVFGAGPPPPPPSMLRLGDLFTPDELQAHQKLFQEHFDRVDHLRTQFADDLSKRALSREEVLKHLSEVDAAMDSVREKLRGEVATKISELPDDKRVAFAKTLKEKPGRGRGPMPALPPHDDAPPATDHK